LHLVVIYGMAGLGKLQGPSWWMGTALWGTMTAGEFVVFDFTPMARWPLLINGLTHASLTLELLYPILIWIRVTRPLMLLAAAAMHLGIAVMSPGLTEFTLAMLAANLAFVPGSWLRRLVADPDRPPLRILFDGACPRCRSTMAMFTSADPGRAIEPIDFTAVDVRTVDPALTSEACRRAMHVVSGPGQVSAGFVAVRSVTARLPLFWPFVAVAYLPGVATLGRVVYNRIAVTRPRDVPCTDQTCGIHSGTSRPGPRVLRGHVPNPHNTSAYPADSQEVPRP
jgi:predicted DCC family thiol-disulfide oxidoreductase YuxK